MLNKTRLYREAFFAEAKYFNKLCTTSDVLMVVISLSALFFHLWWLYITVYVIQLFTVYFNACIIRNKSIALELSRIEILILACGLEGFERRMSDLIGNANRRIRLHVNKKNNSIDKYYNAVDLLGEDCGMKLKLMVQENAYWNHFLFQKCAEDKLITFGGVFIIFFIGLLFTAYQKITFGYSYFDFIVVLFSFAAIWRCYSEYFKYRDASKKMRSCDDILSSGCLLDERSLLLIFSEYNIILTCTGDIKQKIYEKYSRQLNDGWNSRLAVVSI
ncbi:MAG: hypothetical protein HGA49_10860 [Eubacteriaceae bacterium]|nr:hypothetical protein [Eubacteriaceae bacterium]